MAAKSRGWRKGKGGAHDWRIMKMREGRVDLAVLTRDMENAQRGYDAALARAIAVKMDSKVRKTNLAVLTPAVEPAIGTPEG